ncbi:MAG: hypothetical protein EZS28_007810 [Streblomastix strix]|uniref:carnosine N-methyltransferase n=1 Tax=Streblomastix strix TaxID=222440 RepID=A0A5J4WP07_9EUKA|nr:MAG: hypothetical protein EZS28_007810 [Streblomastix strix]
MKALGPINERGKTVAVEQSERRYAEIILPGKKLDERKVFFFPYNWTVGKVIDQIASIEKIKNNSNVPGEKKLCIYEIDEEEEKEKEAIKENAEKDKQSKNEINTNISNSKDIKSPQNDNPFNLSFHPRSFTPPDQNTDNFITQSRSQSPSNAINPSLPILIVTVIISILYLKLIEIQLNILHKPTRETTGPKIVLTIQCRVLKPLACKCQFEYSAEWERMQKALLSQPLSRMEKMKESQDDDSKSNSGDEISEEMSQDEEERAHYVETVHAFMVYNLNFLKKISGWERSFETSRASKIPSVASSFAGKIDALKLATEQNQRFLNYIIEPMQQQVNIPEELGKKRATDWNFGRVQTTLLQFCREWSSMGERERQLPFSLIFTALAKHPRVLVPGAGLGRLCYDLAARGYHVQGNEFSLYMLLASQAVLNRMLTQVDRSRIDNEVEVRLREQQLQQQANDWMNQDLSKIEKENKKESDIKEQQINQYQSSIQQSVLHSQQQDVIGRGMDGRWIIYPFIRSLSNHVDNSHLLRPIAVPDAGLPCPKCQCKKEDFDMSMSAGDFLDVYQDDQCIYDCVVTHFFLDTAHDVCQYMDLIHQLLVDDGIWINYGPLQYHYSEDHNEVSVELTLTEIMELVRQCGFNVMEESMYRSPYCQNELSMALSEFSCKFFVARRMERPGLISQKRLPIERAKH